MFKILRSIVAASLIVGASGALAKDHWVAGWATSLQAPEERNRVADADLTDATLRQVVRLTIGGSKLRVIVSNAFGTEPLRVDAVHIGLSSDPATSRIAAGSDRALTFDGSPAVIIPAGASYRSDPVDLAVPALGSVAITVHYPTAPVGQTTHTGSHATSYLIAGNHVADDVLTGAKPVERWLQMAGVEVAAAPDARAIVTFGDSITDGHGATTNGNDRWPDRLAERLKAASASRNIAVLNHGIGGNRLLREGTGPSALARFDRDVLAQSGVRYVVVLEGVNDIGTLTREASAGPAEHTALVARAIGVYRQIITRAHDHGIKAYGATILPYSGAGYYSAAGDADRQAINAWIRAPGNFDAVIDFDAATRNPARPEQMRAEFDSGDHLHPSPAGYRAMGDVIPLKLFR
ncbi:SGNH/GDSL hydrolase family protein [Glacieibacterium sp.]|uniref:SGNH/GDSL hydrolase family protein n=1 Tax=Glacieibacterium sp. TaxID=2860237 RepID=UPI003B003EF5